jgi:hypothetical protein
VELVSCLGPALFDEEAGRSSRGGGTITADLIFSFFAVAVLGILCSWKLVGRSSSVDIDTSESMGAL